MNKELGGKFQGLSDEQLLLLIKQGNRVAFHQIYDKYWEGLLAYTLNIVKDKTPAEDTVQELFVKIWTRREEMNIGNLKQYLYSAARNRALLKLRYYNKFSEFDVDVISGYCFPPTAEQELDYNDLKSKVEIAAHSLPKRCKEIFFLSRFHQYSIKEIAAHFNISNHTVENQLYLANKHIRTKLGKALYFFISFVNF